jgi:hypothetical protein
MAVVRPVRSPCGFYRFCRRQLHNFRSRLFNRNRCRLASAVREEPDSLDGVSGFADDVAVARFIVAGSTGSGATAWLELLPPPETLAIRCADCSLNRSAAALVCS